MMRLSKKLYSSWTKEICICQVILNLHTLALNNKQLNSFEQKLAAILLCVVTSITSPYVIDKTKNICFRYIYSSVGSACLLT